MIKSVHKTSSLTERRGPGIWQTGGLTVFTAIFVLILMTLMLLYATRIGVFEQRNSANDVRQKTAFHAAESAIEQGFEYVIANAPRMFEDDLQAVPYGVDQFRAGWFANDGTTPGWQACTAAMIAMADHPCGGDLPASTGAFFYDDPTTTSGTDSLPLDSSAFPAGTAARVSLLMCIVDFADPAAGCIAAPATEEEEYNAVAMLQIMGYGFSDCTNVADLGTCTGKAGISRPVSNFKVLAGSPTVPLTSKSTFPPGGTAEVVASPNGGGVGVPVSVWSNNNTSCTGSPPVAVAGAGAWATCELNEWYGQDSIPDDVVCATAPCSCTQAESISYSVGASLNLGIDIIEDNTFPCDLFEYYFDIPRDRYKVIKDAATIISDCDNLGPNDNGLYWVSGSTCNISANTVIGSPEIPIVLISAASTTRLNGGADFFGILYVFDGEDASASISSSGNNTVYGAMIVDAAMGNFGGTFAIVYNAAVLGRARGTGFGSLSGGWRDFGLPDW